MSPSRESDYGMRRGMPKPVDAYWEERGRVSASSELDGVCYAGAPPFLNRYAAWSQRRAVERLLSRVGGLAGKRALDLGCGTGRWSRLLAALEADVVGIDRSGGMLAEAARRSPGIDFRRMRATELELSDDEFDLAVAVTVIQHIPSAEQPKAVSELVRVVRRGGMILCIDREGPPSEFELEHATFPRRRADWIALWRSAGAEPVAVRGQEFSYPLELAARLRRRAQSEGTRSTPAPRRSSQGWARHVMRGLVAASYTTEVAMATVAPGAPAKHTAALYRVQSC